MTYSDLLKVTSAVDQCYALPSWHAKLEPRLEKPTTDIPLDIGIARAAAVITSLVSLRKLHDFMGCSRRNSDDLICSDFGIEKTILLDKSTRDDVNKSIAHITSVDENVDQRDFWKIYQTAHPKICALLDDLEKYYSNEKNCVLEIDLTRIHINDLFAELVAAVEANS